MHRRTRRSLLLLSTLLLAAAVTAQPALAGTEIVSGEDEHCASAGPADAICIATRKTIEYARGGAPDPSKPLLLIECEGDVDYVKNAYTTDPPTTVVCP